MFISIDIFGSFESREVLYPPFLRELPALLLHLNAAPAPIHGKNLFHAAIRKLECASCAEPFLEPKSYRLQVSLAFYRLLLLLVLSLLFPSSSKKEAIEWCDQD